MKIQANGEYPDKRLWLELPISDDPDWIKTTGKLAVLAAPGQTAVTLRVKDVESPVPNLKRYILADNGKITISQMNLLAQEISAMMRPLLPTRSLSLPRNPNRIRKKAAGAALLLWC